MRITSGTLRGRKIAAPKGDHIRPTSDKARQALFNILQHGKWLQDLDYDFSIDGAYVADVCCGTGALGLEALSLGATDAVFVDNDRRSLALCRDNVAACHATEHSHIIQCAADRIKKRPSHITPRSLVFLDPPYDRGLPQKILKTLADKDWLAQGCVCVVESEKDMALNVPGFVLRDDRAYGLARVRIFSFEPAALL